MSKSSDKQGLAPDSSGVALLLIDVINDFDFPEADQLLQFAKPMAEKLSALASRARSADVPVIYVNDNFGRWRSDFRAQIDHCTGPEARGRQIVHMLEPKKNDYFVLKPKHSGFYSTTLETLLEYLQVHTIILSGVAANICVLFTANDAYMRDLNLVVPEDCVASNTEELTRFALEQMRTVLKARIMPADQITSEELSRLVAFSVHAQE